MNKEDIILEINNKNINEAYVLGCFYNKACLGKVKNKDIMFNSDVDYSLLTKIIIFNKDIQISYVLDDETNKFIKSEIVDGDRESFDEYMIISGNTIKDTNDEFTTITELGRIVDIPFIVSDAEVKKGIRLVVRNYFGVDNNKQVTLSESRLVGFALEEGKIYE